MTVVNGIDTISFTSSGPYEQNFMTQRSLAMRESIVRLKCKRALKQRQSLQRRFRHSCIRERCRAQDEIVGVEIIWTFALGPFDLCLAQTRLDCSDRADGYFILHRENIIDRTIVALGPNMRTSSRFNQLRCYPHAARRFPDATFEYVTHAQLTSNLLNIDCSALISETRVARDDEEPFDSR